LIANGMRTYFKLVNSEHHYDVFIFRLNTGFQDGI